MSTPRCSSPSAPAVIFRKSACEAGGRKQAVPKVVLNRTTRRFVDRTTFCTAGQKVGSAKEEQNFARSDMCSSSPAPRIVMLLMFRMLGMGCTRGKIWGGQSRIPLPEPTTTVKLSRLGLLSMLVPTHRGCCEVLHVISRLRSAMLGLFKLMPSDAVYRKYLAMITLLALGKRCIQSRLRSLKSKTVSSIIMTLAVHGEMSSVAPPYTTSPINASSCALSSVLELNTSDQKNALFERRWLVGSQ